MAKILAVGGGSGGHVTPVVAVFRELRANSLDHELRFWCDPKFFEAARGIVHGFDISIPVEKIMAGKFRRYHGASRWHYLAPSIFWPNVRDFFRVVVGFFQSLWRLMRWRPDVIFAKGGYVCLPVGWAARFLRIPLVIHDSDAHPGLTNRLLAPMAVAIGTGAPLKYYSYPADKAHYIGIPVAPEFRPYTSDERAEFKRQLGFPGDQPLVVVTGGGLGAVRINNAVVAARDKLLKLASVYLISGHHQYQEIVKRYPSQGSWRVDSFVSKDMAMVLAAADIVVARAGATTLLELAALAKPTIIVPNGMLTAGHQLKNAKVYQDAMAAIVVKEEDMMQDPDLLATQIEHLLRADTLRSELGHNFYTFAKPKAAADMAQIIISSIKGRGR